MARSKEVIRRKILDAAYLQFRQKGFSRVNVDQIASSADVTKRTLCSHFSSKDALLEEILKLQEQLAFFAFQTFGEALVGSMKQIVRVFFRN